MKKRIIAICVSSAISTHVFAHGWQTLPLTRVDYLYQTDRGAVGYEPQSVASNLIAGGSSTYAQITGFSGGPLGFFKKNHAIQNGNLCSNGHAAWSRLLEPLPANKITKVSNGQTVNFAWTKTAAHTPSNHFTFITNYKAGEYNPTPSWQDLHYLSGCDAAGTSKGTDNYNCKLQLANQQLQGKQVIVSIWQRVDPVGENFVSCADVEFDGGGVIVTPSWNAIDSKSWISSISQPKANELVTFKLTKNNIVIASYSLSITANNLSKWDSILAAKVNNDTSLNALAAIGVLNTTTGAVTYDEANQSKDYVYINKGVAESNAVYGYTLTKQNDPNPITVSWSAVGYKLKDWLQTVKAGDKLSFALNKNGVETDTISNISVTSVANAEQNLATAINNYTFKNSVQVKAGVLNNGTVGFVAGGQNQVYVYKSSDSTDEWSYVVRNIPASSECSAVSTWSSTSVYTAGNQVSYDGVIYKARWWTTGNNPAENNGVDGSGKVWGVVSNCSGTTPTPTPTPTPSPTPVPTPTPTPSPTPAPGNYPVYPSGTGTYVAGSIVQGTDGNLYECKPWPFTAWCNGGSWAYAPGTGSDWQSAWTKR